MLQEGLEPNPEQTTSLASLVSFTFLSPVIWTAWKLPHFPYDLLPPLADYDHLRNLVGKSFPVSAKLHAVSRDVLLKRLLSASIPLKISRERISPSS